MFLATTRFNKQTLEENRNFIKNNNINGVVYGAPLRINEKYPLGCFIFVIEMNNDINEIIGISIIKNRIVFDNKDIEYNIYTDRNFNRYIYKGKYLISREYIIEKNPTLVSIIENILFKGKSHLKRISGIAVIKDKLLYDRRCQGMNLLNEVNEIFKDYLNDIDNNNNQNNI